MEGSLNSGLFQRCVALIMELEGGDRYTNDPQDPGGETKYGISKRAFPQEDIRGLTLERAMGIYRDRYWGPIRGDRLPPQLALCVFDCAVNQGQGAAIRLLQCAVRAKEDGVMGDKTIHLVERMDAKGLLADYMCRRVHRYLLSDDYAQFGKGWVRRLFRITYEAHAIATGGV